VISNGKIERFFKEVEMRINTQFKSIEEIVIWQNEMKPHTTLGYKRPKEIFNYCLTPERILGYAMRRLNEA
jgi:IS30 family transposase